MLNVIYIPASLRQLGHYFSLSGNNIAFCRTYHFLPSLETHAGIHFVVSSDLTSWFRLRDPGQ